MAGIPLKSGADFYNLEASRMRLHNLGADPTEFGLGQIYYNSSSGNNTSGRARLYTGNGFRSLAFMDDITAIQEQLDLLSGEVDTDSIISNMKEVSAFLEGFAEDASLMDLLNSKANAGIESGKGYVALPYANDKQAFIFYNGGFEWSLTNEGWNGSHKILHQGNYSDYALPLTGGTITGALTLLGSGTAYLAFAGTNGTAYGSLGISSAHEPKFWDGSGAYTLIHSGNYATEIGDYYLKSSGGTIRGSVMISGNADTNVPLNIATPSMGYTGYIRFGATITAHELGHLGFSAKGVPAMMYEGTTNTLLHSGNIGEYALKTDGSNEMKDVLFLNFSNPRIAFKSGDKTHGSFGYFSDGLKWYNSSENAYHTIAFTDSTVAAANRLVSTNDLSLVRLDSDKLYVGNGTYSNYPLHLMGKEIRLRYMSGDVGLMLTHQGNVLINSTDDDNSGAKLQVSGGISLSGAIRGVTRMNMSGGDYGFYRGSNFSSSYSSTEIVYHATRHIINGDTQINGNLHVTGNIIADKEVSAGGAAEESGEGGGGTGGGVEPYVFTFTPSTTTVSVNHNISSEDVIVQVFEKDATSGKWNVILVDIEIVDSTRVDLHFGRTETTEHKVVIIG